MFKNTYQSGLLSIFSSCGSDPLAMWDCVTQNGHIRRLTDREVNSLVLEISSTNVATTYITCPKNKAVLGIKLPFLVMIVKNLKRYFSFEITILDDKNMRRRFRISNFQSTTKIKPFCTTMPIGLSSGWNQIQFNLADFTRRAYGTQFIESQRVQVHANVRIRRIYFSDRLYGEEELPQDYKLYLPLDRKKKKEQKKEEPIPTKPVPSKATPSETPAEPAEAPPPPPQETVEVAAVAEEEKPAEQEKPDEAPPEEAAAEGEAPAEGEEVSEAPAEAPEGAVEAPPAEEGEAPTEAPAEAPAETPVEDTPAEAPAEE